MNECKPLDGGEDSEVSDHDDKKELASAEQAMGRGFHSLTSKLNLRGPSGHSAHVTSELNLSTFGPLPRVTLGCVGDKVSLR